MKSWLILVPLLLLLSIGQGCNRRLKGSALNEAIEWQVVRYTIAHTEAHIGEINDQLSNEERDTIASIMVEVVTPRCGVEHLKQMPSQLLDLLQRELYGGLMEYLEYPSEKRESILNNLPKEGANKDLEEEIRQWGSEAMAQHLARAKAEADEARLDMPAERSRETMNILLEMEEYIGDTILFNKNGLLSIERSLYSWAGGAHGVSSVVVLNFDLEKAVEIPISDLFIDREDPALLQLVEESFLKLYGAKDLSELQQLYNLFVMNDPERGEGVFVPDLFSFTEEGIQLTYSEYEIGPYSIGMPTVTLPYDRVAPFIVPSLRNRL